MPGTLKSGGSRVYLTRYGSGPSRAPVYYPNAKAGTPSVNPGGITTIWGPDPHRYNNFIPVDEVQAGQERTTMDIMGRYPIDRLSELLSIAQSKCNLDALIPIGECRDPSRINSGWDKMLVLLDARLTTWTLDRDLGALEPGDNAAVNEQSTLSAAIVGEVDRMRLVEVAASELSGAVTGIAVCDSPSCGDCGGAPGDGCQRVFALSSSSTASPAASNDLLYSTNGGATWTAVAIPVAQPAAEPSQLVCTGDYLVFLIEAASLVVSVPVADLLSGSYTFTTQTTVVANFKAAYSAAPDATWIAGDTGYIWLLPDPASGLVTKKSTGTESYRAIHAIDTWNVVAVGASNVVTASNDAGETWRSITGPAGGVTLTTINMRSATEWIVGTQTGFLYYTEDGGATWHQIGFPGTGTGVVRDLKFAPDLPNVGYMAHNLAGPPIRGRILRTIDGGHSWYVMPEPGVAGGIPLNDYIAVLAVCHANRIYAGGLADDNSDGIMLVGSAA